MAHPRRRPGAGSVTRFALLRVATLPFGALDALHGREAVASLRAVLDAERALDDGAGGMSDLLFAAAGPPGGDAAHARARFALLRVRRDVHAGRPPRPRDLDEAAPLLTPETAVRLTAHAGNLERLAEALSAHEIVWARALAGTRQRLLAISESPLVAHGIYLASRSLSPKVRRLARHDPARWSHDERHTGAKVAAYVARFAAKTSPNGVFCAVAPAHIEGDEASVRGTGGIARADVLLSLAEVRKVTACLAVDPRVERAVVPRPNPTLLLRDGAWWFWKPASPRNPTDAEVHARVKDQPVLRAFLEEAARGTHRPDRLARAVASRTGVPEADLRDFYEKLVERGILIGEVEIPWSSRRRFRDLALVADGAGCDAPWIATLFRIEDAVDAVSGMPLPERAEAMEAIVREVEALPRKRPFKADELFRVDAASSLEVRLPERVFHDLREAMKVLVTLLAAIYPEEDQHRSFVRRFVQEHPPDTDVPFLDLYGGLAEPEDEGAAPPMEFPEPAVGESTAARRVWEWLARTAAAAAPDATIELDAATLRSLVGDLTEPRWTAGVLFQIGAREAEALGAGRYLVAINAVFNGIGLALSRFAHLLADDDGGGAILAELRRAWAVLERPGTEIVELTFNHEARTANAGLRPLLFPREIELPGDTVSPGVERIPLSDLALRYDTGADRLVLRRVSTGTEVVPVVSSGVSPSGIVSTLIHVGRQGWQTVGHLPGFQASAVTRWPRVVCGKVVLFRARWIFDAVRGPSVSLGGASLSDAAFFLEAGRWRAANALPRHVFVHTTVEPKPFYVDLESPVLADLLRRAVTAVAALGSARLVVTEMLPAPEDLWVRDGAGAYAAEFLVQMAGPESGEALAASSS